jgi:hypothetical protein
VIVSVENDTEPVNEREITEAKMGPTHGVHTSPRDKPMSTPPQKPSFCFVFGANATSLLKNISIYSCTLGTTSENPKNPTTKTDKNRNASGEMPVSFTVTERKRVKKVKLNTNPVMTPRGLFFPPPMDPDKTIGSIGNMQGERMVTIPAKKAKRIKRIISICDASHIINGRRKDV